MQAIETKYLGPTNTKGSRIKASTWRGSVVVGFRHDLSHDDAHAHAVRTLLDKFRAEDVAEHGEGNHGWGGDWVGGRPDGKASRMVWVNACPRSPRITIGGES